MGVQDEKLRTGNRKTVFSVTTNDNSPVTFFFLFLSWEGMSVFLLNCPLSSGRDSAISPLTVNLHITVLKNSVLSFHVLILSFSISLQFFAVKLIAKVIFCEVVNKKKIKKEIKSSFFKCPGTSRGFFWSVGLLHTFELVLYCGWT